MSIEFMHFMGTLLGGLATAAFMTIAIKREIARIERDLKEAKMLANAACERAGMGPLFTLETELLRGNVRGNVPKLPRMTIV